jgi:hypothetical protein
MNRALWLQRLVPLATPPLAALAEGRLLATLPLAPARPDDHHPARRDFASLEILARTLVGLAPWLELDELPDDERAPRDRLAALARSALARALEPDSPDSLNFSRGAQPLVDAAFLAQACLHAPATLFESLPAATRERLIAGWRATRAITPYENNWHLFAAMVEAALFRFAGEREFVRVDTALARHAAWYVGDGTYGDGPEYHWDYYNSFVIQPMLLDVLAVLHPVLPRPPAIAPDEAWRRARRFAQVQERMVAPDGSFPPLGRSLAYRCGAFQHLAFMALRRALPPEIPPSAARGALSAVIARTLDAPGTFDAAGWLRIGLAGHQPSLGEGYISVASCYLCTTAFLPLGLPASDPFWAAPDAAWTSKRLWNGEDLPADHALGKEH